MKKEKKRKREKEKKRREEKRREEKKDDENGAECSGETFSSRRRHWSKWKVVGLKLERILVFTVNAAQVLHKKQQQQS